MKQPQSGQEKFVRSYPNDTLTLEELRAFVARADEDGISGKTEIMAVASHSHRRIDAYGTWCAVVCIEVREG